MEYYHNTIPQIRIRISMFLHPQRLINLNLTSFSNRNTLARAYDFSLSDIYKITHAQNHGRKSNNNASLRVAIKTKMFSMKIQKSPEHEKSHLFKTRVRSPRKFSLVHDCVDLETVQPKACNF